jgi:hypothetical protein
MLNYITNGGNLLLATREGADFFNTDFQNYCGITSFSGLSTLSQLIALDDSLVNIPVTSTNDRNQFVLLDAGSEATPIFDDNVGTNFVAGFRIQKENHGGFIYIAGRPYRFNNTAMHQDYDYMIDNWLNYSTIPVELTSFTANVIDNSVELNWTTATELNNSGFEIERSNDNITFANLGFVPGCGTTTETKNYTYTDRSLNRRVFYYRLKQIDFDGSFNYSSVIGAEVSIPGVFALAQNFPNPFNPVTLIKYQVPEQSLVSIKIYDLIGREVAVLVNEVKQPGTYQVNFDSGNFASGVYFYKMVAGDFSKVKKMNLLK